MLWFRDRAMAWTRVDRQNLFVYPLGGDNGDGSDVRTAMELSTVVQRTQELVVWLSRYRTSKCPLTLLDRLDSTWS